MASLGSFGTVHETAEVEPDTFDWFGSTIRLTPLSLNEIELIDLMEMTKNADVNDPTSLVVVKDLFRQVIHTDDFDTFWSTAKKQRQGVDDLMPVYQVLLSEATDRPTQRQSDSSPGLPRTVENSPAVSPSPELPGRPDLVLLQQGGEETRRLMEARARAAALAG